MLHAEHLLQERHLGLQCAAAGIHAPEAVALVLESDERQRLTGGAHGLGHGVGLVRGHHLVLQALQDQHGRLEVRQLRDGGAVQVRLLCLGPRSDEAVRVPGLGLVGVRDERPQVADPVGGDTSGEDVGGDERLQRGVPAGAAASDGHACRINETGVGDILHRGHHVSDVENAPLALEPVAVGATEAGGS